MFRFIKMFGVRLSLEEQLKCCYERNSYAIAVIKRLRRRLADSTVGHLPREISRAARFFLLRGGAVCTKVIDKNHRRCPILQGGLVIPVEVTAQMDLTDT